MRVALRALGVVLVVGGALAAALAWRLSRGPVDITIVAPYLERALGRPDGSRTVRIGAAELAWDAREHEVDLRARQVEVRGQRGELLASLPSLGLELSAVALLGGVVAPRTIELLGPRLHLVGQPGGRVELDVEKTSTGPSGNALPGLLAELGGGGLHGQLRRLAVRDGEVVLTDRASGRTWRAVGVQIDLERTQEGVSIALAGAARIGDAVIPLQAEGLYGVDDASVAGTVRFEGLELPVLAAALPPAAWSTLARRIELPLTGRVGLMLDHALRPRRIRLEAAGGPGKISAPELPAGALPIELLRLAAGVDLDTGTVSLEELSLDLLQTTARVHGRLVSLNGAHRFGLGATVSRLPTAAIAAYWAEAAWPEARRWVTARVTDGMLRRGAARLRGRANGAQVTVEGVRGRLAFDGVTVRFLDTMPAAREVAGTASFTPGAGSLRVARGAVGGLEIVRATVGLDGAGQQGAADVSVRGPLAAALALARSLDQGRALALVPDPTAGAMAADLQLRFPLGRGRAVVTGDLAVSARMQEVAVPRAFRGWSFTGGDLGLDLRGNALQLAGRGTLEGAPIALTWREQLGVQGGAERRVEVGGQLDTAARTALGFDLRPWLEGPVEVRAELAQQGGAGTLALSADLAGATLDVPVLALAKPAGAPGRVEGRAALTGAVVTAVERISLQTQGTSVTGDATFSQDGRTWRTVQAAATLAPRERGRAPGRLTLAVRPESRAHRFVLTSDDAGALFRVLGPGADAAGGALRYAGTVELDAPGLPIDGGIEVRDFTLLSAPLLARIATLASLPGITSALGGRGMEFHQLSAGLAHRGTTLTITDGVASGPSLALLLAGTIDREGWTASLTGTLVPAYYGLNTAAKRVPVLGGVVTGRDREGFQAFDFTARGPLASPQVAVNPLSSIAPGVLRDILRRVPARPRR